ncbi:Holliday junction resolvase RecU [Alkalicoccus daliensis]|uniref:Holliday junction resolvase RecU n=1 Tax=Alkalicoccus daliensis TaxID=745820 RepID=A0A1H0AT17_9BACI|nr:Holliday junction resolvase RecU [Alkalicoccus daliensis]SDN36206.1 recombination protein U [Alkalicoccus daliensis]
MPIRYPNGKKFIQKRIPDKKKSDYKKDDSFSNRGMSFEDDIQESNEYYRVHEKAVIHKKPTPLQIVNVHYPHRSAAVVTEAYFQKPSTTDFNGVYKGLYIDFEAKETRNKTSFPLKNFHAHQIEHMKSVLSQQGIVFVLLHFRIHQEIYLVPGSCFIEWFDNKDQARKSIPKKEIEKNGIPVSTGYLPKIDYLAALDKWLHNQ